MKLNWPSEIFSPPYSSLNTSNEVRDSSFCPCVCLCVSLSSDTALSSAAFPLLRGSFRPQTFMFLRIHPQSIVYLSCSMSALPQWSRGWRMTIAPVSVSSPRGHCSGSASPSEWPWECGSPQGRLLGPEQGGYGTNSPFPIWGQFLHSPHSVPTPIIILLVMTEVASLPAHYNICLWTHC